VHIDDRHYARRRRIAPADPLSNDQVSIVSRRVPIFDELRRIQSTDVV
jgi:hypothetical protein